MLDFDGTLAQITSEPSQARLHPQVRSVFREMAKQFWQDLAERVPPRIATGILSGRALGDVRQRTGFCEFAYSGNHGLEMEAFGVRRTDPAAEAARTELRELCDRLAAETDSIPGAFVEHKDLTATVHYRRAPELLASRLPAVVARVMQPAAARFRVRRALKAWEILPRTPANKGTAVDWLRGCFGDDRLPIYLGDDASDEDAFRGLRGGVTIRVGAGMPTQASYAIPDPAGVADFLFWLVFVTGALRQSG